jgi:hypothetical protein
MFAGWHPNNGVYLDAPGLRFVVTKVFQDGEPYDEGYFEDVGHPLDEDERLVFRPVSRSPRFDPAAAPALDSKQWPATRLALAKRKYAAAYYFDGVETCFERYGVAEAAALMAAAFRIYWTQFLPEVRAAYGVTGRNAKAAADVIRRAAEDAGESVEVSSTKSGFRVVRENRSLAGADFPQAIHAANASYVSALVYVMSADVRATLDVVRIAGTAGTVEEWSLDDTAERVY